MSADTIVNFFLAYCTGLDILIGKAWYQVARLECAQLAARFNVELRKVAYIVAALSPSLPWDRNILAARHILEGRERAGSAYGANVVKAKNILANTEFDDILRGSKVRSFAANILGDSDRVTVDRWAYRIWAGDLAANCPTPIRNYEQIADDYRTAADRLGLTPAELQAITWVAARREVTGQIDNGAQLALPL